MNARSHKLMIVAIQVAVVTVLFVAWINFG